MALDPALVAALRASPPASPLHRPPGGARPSPAAVGSQPVWIEGSRGASPRHSVSPRLRSRRVSAAAGPAEGVSMDGLTAAGVTGLLVPGCCRGGHGSYGSGGVSLLRG